MTVTMIALVLVAISVLGTLIAGTGRRWRERRSIDEYSVAMRRLRDLSRRYGVDEVGGPRAPESEQPASESPKARAPFTDAAAPEMASQHPNLLRLGALDGAGMGRSSIRWNRLIYHRHRALPPPGACTSPTSSCRHIQ